MQTEMKKIKALRLAASSPPSYLHKVTDQVLCVCAECATTAAAEPSPQNLSRHSDMEGSKHTASPQEAVATPTADISSSLAVVPEPSNPVDMHATDTHPNSTGCMNKLSNASSSTASAAAATVLHLQASEEKEAEAQNLLEGLAEPASGLSECYTGDMFRTTMLPTEAVAANPLPLYPPPGTSIAAANASLAQVVSHEEGIAVAPLAGVHAPHDAGTPLELLQCMTDVRLMTNTKFLLLLLVTRAVHGWTACCRHLAH